MYKRVLLKLSGEALGNGKGIYDPQYLDALAEEIKDIKNLGIEVAIVVGGGNLIRGRILEELGFDRVSGDFMGMMSTVMNAIALENIFKDHNIKAKAFSAIDVEGCEKYEVAKTREYLEEGYVCIFGGGVSQPYFTTDSATILRAIENKCDVVLIGKNGVDGVYDADPAISKDAKRFDAISYDELLERGLKVIDASAAVMASEQDLDCLIFSMNEPGNIKKAITDKTIGTIISSKEKLYVK